MKTNRTIHGTGYRFRPATPSDVPGILELEKAVWGGHACSHEMLASRMDTFPEGQIVAVTRAGLVVGYIALQFIDDPLDGTGTWDEVTDHGTIQRSHNARGKYMFGLSLTAHPEHPGVGLQLQLEAWAVAIKHDKPGCFLGSRVPRYHKVAQRYSIAEWVRGKNGRSLDPEVRYYQKANFRIMRIVPNYFPDPDSLDYGVLMYCPVHGLLRLFPRISAYLVRRHGFAFLRMMGYVKDTSRMAA